MIRCEGVSQGFSIGLGLAGVALVLLAVWWFWQGAVSVGTPFLAALIISILLDPIVVWTQRRVTDGQRTPAVFLVFLVFLLCFIALIAFLVPNLINQTSRLIAFFVPASYTVERSTPGSIRWLLVEEEVAGETFTVENLTNGIPYLFRVTAQDAEGNQVPLPTVMATPRSSQELEVRPEIEEPDMATDPAGALVSAMLDGMKAGGSNPAAVTRELTRQSDASGETPADSNAPPPNAAAPDATTAAPDDDEKPSEETTEAVAKELIEGSPRAEGGETPTVSDAATPDPDSMKPGTIYAEPGNRAVRLIWKQPDGVRSGFDRLRQQADDWLSSHRKVGPFSLPPNIAELQRQYSEQITATFKEVTTRFGAFLGDSVSRLLTIVLVPVLTFYFLSDLPRLRARFLFILPRSTRREFVKGANDIGDAFGSYLRGMFILSVLYGTIGTVVFFVGGLQAYAILVGFIAGLLYAIPFLGPALTLSVVVIVSLVTGHSLVHTAILLGAALLQNFIFDNFLTPRVVGKEVGIHPLLAIFSVFLGGQLFGFLGVVFAVPLAAGIQTIVARLFPRIGAPLPEDVIHPVVIAPKNSPDGSVPPATP
ncbi:MAG: hypothetical protein OHK0029_33530 [Armatimonadaceae bacterium]